MIRASNIFLKLDERPTIMESAGSNRYTDQELIDQLRQSGTDKRRSEEQLFNRYIYFVREGMTKHAIPILFWQRWKIYIRTISRPALQSKLTSTKYFITNVLTFFEKERLIRIPYTARR
jgi:hypothetical protein